MLHDCYFSLAISMNFYIHTLVALYMSLQSAVSYKCYKTMKLDVLGISYMFFLHDSIPAKGS